MVDGDLDIGIIVAHRELSGLEYRDFIVEEQGLYCGIGHPLFTKQSSEIDWKRVEACDRVGQKYVDSGDELRDHFSGRPAAVAHSAEALSHLILSGHYIGVLPVHYADQWVRQGAMRILLPREFNPRSQIRIIQKKGAGSARIANSFLDVLFQVSHL